MVDGAGAVRCSEGGTGVERYRGLCTATAGCLCARHDEAGLDVDGVRSAERARNASRYIAAVPEESVCRESWSRRTLELGALRRWSSESKITTYLVRSHVC